MRGLNVQKSSTCVTSQIEAIVPAIYLCTWSHLILGPLWLRFIDNDGALACLVSGCSLSWVAGRGLKGTF